MGALPSYALAVPTSEWVNSAIGQAVGRPFADQYFTADTNAKISELVANIRAAMKDRILTNDWLSEQTKQQALGKLEKLRVNIGYPATWRDYNFLVMHPGQMFENRQRARTFEWQHRVSRLSVPVDRCVFQ